MPFKDPERAREWNRAYQQRRDAKNRHTRVKLEHLILHVVAAEPFQHDTLSLFARFRGDNISLQTITRTIRRLGKDGVFRWGRPEGTSCGNSTGGLALTDRAREVLAPPAGPPAGEQANDDREVLVSK